MKRQEPVRRHGLPMAGRNHFVANEQDHRLETCSTVGPLGGLAAGDLACQRDMKMTQHSNTATISSMTISLVN